ncbi:MAG: hypothetical protein WC895_04795 [Candidatus Shapirobacteria bacterium]|jgi:hypothetical protein
MDKLRSAVLAAFTIASVATALTILITLAVMSEANNKIKSL